MTGRMAQEPVQRAGKSVGNVQFCIVCFGVFLLLLLLVAFLRTVFCERTLLLEVLIIRNDLLEDACLAYSFPS